MIIKTNEDSRICLCVLFYDPDEDTLDIDVPNTLSHEEAIAILNEFVEFKGTVRDNSNG